MTTTVLVVDDDPLARDAIAAVLISANDLIVVGEAGSGEDALDLARELKPDVVLMDVQMAGLGGVEATRALTADGADAAPVVLVLTALRDVDTIEALRAGASGFLLKRSARDLVAAVRALAAGEGWIDTAVVGDVLQQVRRVAGAARVATNPAGLTRREQEVLTLMTEGLTNEDIATRIWTALPTVKTHVTRILTKTGSRNRTEAVAFAFRSGLRDSDCG